MENLTTKPKLVFFQFNYDAELPEFLLIHKREHVKCLTRFFDVTVIDEDCDYQQICETYQPNLVLFETGLNLLSCKRHNIKNIRACSDIPRLGFHNADAWCETRAGILSDMDHWGIETSFSIAATAREHTPEIADRLFIWPNSVDPEVYRDYGESKIIPVLFTGSNAAQYPWRQKIYKLISEVYPSLFCPHLGYLTRTSAAQVLFGERYARMINASWCIPACGSVAKEVVRKHFEIPACRACLVTEKSAALEAAGFADMENCVFCDERDVLDKLEHLFRNEDALGKIIDAGYELAQSRHTFKQRDEILQWFKLSRDLKPNQRIVQENPFGGLRIVDRSMGFNNTYVICNGLHLQLLREGDQCLWSGKYSEAEELFVTCSNYMRRMPEPKFRLALCKLYTGNGRAALNLILALIEYVLVEYKAQDPDPVEWAYYIVALICVGEWDVARKRASEFAALRHPELDRVRWLVLALSSKGTAGPPQSDDAVDYRRSIHQMPHRNMQEWSEAVCLMLKASGRGELAARFRMAFSKADRSLQQSIVGRQSYEKPSKQKVGLVGGNRVTLWPKYHLIVSWPVLFGGRRILSRVRSRWMGGRSKVLHSVEAKVGYFLPYVLSEKRRDEFLHLIEGVGRDEDFTTVLVIGAGKGEGTTEALLTGIVESRRKPVAFCIYGLGRRLSRWRKTAKNDAGSKWYRASAPCVERCAEELAITVRSIKEENEIDCFGAVLIDGSEVEHLDIDESVVEDLYRAKFVLLDDINKWSNYQIHQRLLRDSNYVLVACNPGLGGGYAIFKRVSNVGVEELA